MKKENITIFILFFVLSLIFTFPIWSTGKNIGILDWDQHLSWLEAARISVVKYGQFPFWNPYQCGGTPLFAHPQVPIISISFICVLLFGTIIGVKVSIFIHYLIGMYGFYKLSRIFKLSILSTITGAIVCLFSGVLSSAIGSGMIPFIAFTYTPYIIYFYLKSLKKQNTLKNCFFCSLSMSISFYTGYQIILSLLVFIFLTTILISIASRKTLFLQKFLIIIPLFLLLSFPKLFLSIQFMKAYPRNVSEKTGYKPKELFYLLTSHQQSYHSENKHEFNYNFDENSLYIGIIPLLLLIIGLFAKWKTKNIVIFCLIVSLIFMLGNRNNQILTPLIKTIPYLNQFRVFQRFRFIFIIIISIIISQSVEFIQKRLFLNNKFIYIFMVLVIYLDLYLFSKNNFFKNNFFLTEGDIKSNVQFTTYQKSPLSYRYKNYSHSQLANNYNVYFPWHTQLLTVMGNLGHINCYEAIPIEIYAKGIEDSEYRGEVYSVFDSNLKVINYSPNEIVIDIATKYNNILIINQNYFSGWYVLNNGKITKATNNKGLISTSISKDYSGTIKFIYNPFESL